MVVAGTEEKRWFCRYKVTIQQEAFLTARQCLVACPGTTKEGLERVIGDTSSFDKCDQYVQVGELFQSWMIALEDGHRGKSALMIQSGLHSKYPKSRHS